MLPTSPNRAPSPPWTHLIVDADLATMTGDGLGVIRRGVIALSDDRIAWVGTRDELPGPSRDLAAQVTALPHRWITPGLIDPMTALIQGWIQPDNAEAHFAVMADGAPDERRDALARLARDTEDEDLLKNATVRLGAVLKEGVTTVGIPSTPAQDPETALRLLRVARSLGDLFSVTVCAILCAGAASEAERRGMIETAHAGRLVDLVLADAPDETAIAAASELGLPVLRRQGRADQDSARTIDAPRVGEIFMPLAGSDSAIWRSGRSDRPDTGLAIATDSAPDSQPSCSLLLAIGVAVRHHRVSVPAALRAVTICAAQFLEIDKEFGSLEPGKQADLAVWDISHPAALAHGLGFNPNAGVIRGGVPVQPLRPRIEG